MFDKTIFGVPTELQEGRNIDEKIKNNCQILGFEESYLERKRMAET